MKIHDGMTLTDNEVDALPAFGICDVNAEIELIAVEPARLWKLHLKGRQ